MNQDAYAEATNHQNNLNAFQRYERAYWLAYSRSQNPYPPKWQHSSHRRELQRHCDLDALD